MKNNNLYIINKKVHQYIEDVFKYVRVCACFSNFLLYFNY